MSEQTANLLNNETKPTHRAEFREDEFDLLSVREAGKMLGVGLSKMYEIVNNGQIPYVSGFGGKKIRKGAIYDLILKHEQVMQPDESH